METAESEDLKSHTEAIAVKTDCVLYTAFTKQGLAAIRAADSKPKNGQSKRQSR